MGKLKVEVQQWHAIAAWTWDAGDDVCGERREVTSVPHQHVSMQNHQTNLCLPQASAGCRSTAVHQTQSTPAMIRQWCGGSVRTRFICSVSTNGEEFQFASSAVNSSSSGYASNSCALIVLTARACRAQADESGGAALPNLPTSVGVQVD